MEETYFCSFSKCCKTGKGFSRCAACKMTHYCSRKHQIFDWPTHKDQFEPLKAKANKKWLDLTRVLCENVWIKVLVSYFINKNGSNIIVQKILLKLCFF